MTDKKDYNALKTKFGFKVQTPTTLIFDDDGSLRENVYVVDVRDDDNEPISHAFVAENDDHAIDVGTDIVNQFYHRELASGNWIDLMKPERDDDNKAYFDECDYDCIHTFEFEAEDA